MSLRHLIGGFLAALVALPSSAEVVVYRAAAIHPVSGPVIENGAIVVRDGTIEAVGPSLEAPPGAEVVDLGALHLYPGFVHPSSTLGLIEVDSVRGTVDTREVGEMNAASRAEVAFNADSMLLPVTVSGGVLSAHVIVRGGVFMGTSAIMSLEGWNWEDMTISAPTAMHLRFPQRNVEGTAEFDKAIAFIDETLDRAAAYGRAKAAGTARSNRDLEALLPVLDESLPLHVHADDIHQLDAALDWIENRELTNVVLVTTYDARYLADRLAESDIPVILTSVHQIPNRDWEPYDAAYSAPAVLEAAGVRFALGDRFQASDARNLPFEAAMAAAHGLDPAAALASVTLRPAEILGVAERLGSLEVGKDATFIATSGDPLEIMTSIERVWIGGIEVDGSEDKQRRLYEKYRDRPRPAPAEP